MELLAKLELGKISRKIEKKVGAIFEHFWETIEDRKWVIRMRIYKSN